MPAALNRAVVVGASLAGLHAAQALRRQGFDGDLILVGDEPHYPYDRPPLSKDFLTGAGDVDKLRLRPAADPDALGVRWLLGRRAVGLTRHQPSGGQVLLDDGEAVAFDGLVVATGARPRPLPGAPAAPGLHVLRGLDDALALRQALDAGPARVVVVGFGFIGAEVAASARSRGWEVTVVEAAEAPLARVLDAEAGLAVADLHRGHGVDVRLGAGVAGLRHGADGAVTGVELGDGTKIEAPVVMVGIGVTPNTGWLEGAGLTLDDGLVADETCLAAPGIVVAGDVARWPNPRFDRLMRVEQWDNAVEMGGYAGRRLLAWSRDEAVEPFAPVPWFWSDQYDRKIQLAGVPGPGVAMAQGTLAEQRFVRVYHRDGVVVGALCWNRPRQAIQARELVGREAPLDEALQVLG